jgi:hypothetical protein
MLKSYPTPRQWQVQGQILLERALFCVGCEIIFAGTRRCPRCSSVEAVWPLSEWVRSVRPATTGAPLSPSSGEASLPSGHEQKRSAA